MVVTQGVRSDPDHSSKVGTTTRKSSAATSIPCRRGSGRGCPIEPTSADPLLWYRRQGRGRPSIQGRAMTAAERQRRHREKLRREDDVDVDPNPDEIGSTTPVSVTVLSVSPMRAGKLFALASVEFDIDGVPIEIHGIRAMCRRPRPGSNSPPFGVQPVGRGPRSFTRRKCATQIGDALLAR
jgi:hypothetical protein